MEKEAPKVTLTSVLKSSHQWASSNLSNLNSWLSSIHVIQSNAQEFNIYPLHYVLSIISLLILSILVLKNIHAALITQVLGVLFPVYFSVKAIDDNKDIKHWLVYWIVFSCFNLIDLGASTWMHFFPYYFFVKFCGIYLIASKKIDYADLFIEKLKTICIKKKEKEEDKKEGAPKTAIKENKENKENKKEEKVKSKPGIFSSSKSFTFSVKG